MRHLLKHKGYYGEIYFSVEDECYVGSVLGIKSVLAVHEDTASETIKELIASIDDYLSDCAEEGRMPNSTDSSVALEMEAFFRNNAFGSLHAVSANRELAVAN